jgi:hypothetical protein
LSRRFWSAEADEFSRPLDNVGGFEDMRR